MDNIDFEENKNPKTINVDEQTFEYLKVSAKRVIPFAELMGLNDPQVVLRQTTDALILELQAYVLSDHLDPTIITRTKKARFTVPANWWEQFKSAYADRWWLPRFLRNNIKMRIVEHSVEFKLKVTPRRIYPQAALRMPPVMGREFKVYTTEAAND